MTRAQSVGKFFSVGGTVRTDAAYVVRPVDEQLLTAILAGEYCNVLAPRQMGKSSLMVRTVQRLEHEGVRTVSIDLTEMGISLSAEQWYFGFVSSLKRQLRLETDVNAWWQMRAQQGVIQRFSDFMRDVVLQEITEPVVIFVDEIDSSLSLPFTDDFFAAIRAAYNARASDPVYERLTFVLLGVVWPADLIKDRSRTPYNIGLPIDLRDFTSEEAKTLLPGLKAVFAGRAEAILDRVLYWTGGHPYLTQRVCAEISKNGTQRWDDTKIDDLVRNLFSPDQALKEINIQHISRQIQDNRNQESLLRLYRQVLSKPVTDEERDPVMSQLKLTGLVKVTPQGTLAVRNRIYAEVFDQQWVKRTLPQAFPTRIVIAATAVAVIALAFLGLQFLDRGGPTDPDVYVEGFLDAENSSEQINNLAPLFRLGDESADRARELFFNLPSDQQLRMFTNLEHPEQSGDDLQTVIRGIYTRIHESDQVDALLEAMAAELEQINEAFPNSRVLFGEIANWIEGRAHFDNGDNERAIESYTRAIDSNNQNPAVYRDRAWAYKYNEQYDEAVKDLDRVVALDPDRQAQILDLIRSHSSLNDYLMEHLGDFPNLAMSPVTGVPPASADLEDTWTRPADGMMMVYAPGGEFRMGSDDNELNYALQLCQEYSGDCTREQFQDEQPLHTVILDGFWIDETEVTNAQYLRCVEGGVCEESKCWDDDELNAPDWPVVCVTWNDAQAYCEWAGGRLPTEAEWEYAARGPEENIYPWGNEFYDYKLNYCDQNCWADERKDASVDDGYAFTSPVGNYPEGASWCGALDMAGNAWEWVYDWYGPYPTETQVNPTGPETGELKVLRSGSWDYGPDVVRAAHRTQNTPDIHFSDDGFRCVVAPTP